MLSLPSAPPPARALAWTLATRGSLLTAVWATLVEGRPEGLWAGLLAVPLAVAASLALAPAGRTYVHPLALARFLPGFVWQAFAGSVDVARRALHPKLSVVPACVEVPVRLPSLSARLFLSGVASLVPGSLGVDVGEDHVTLHLLDARAPAQEAALRHLRLLERRAAAIFGHPPPGAAP
jgi:multicomponent Na+:H+ antiporter subunit E